MSNASPIAPAALLLAIILTCIAIKLFKLRRRRREKRADRDAAAFESRVQAEMRRREEEKRRVTEACEASVLAAKAHDVELHRREQRATLERLRQNIAGGMRMAQSAGAQPPADPRIVCGNCYERLPANAIFCRKCGRRVNSAASRKEIHTPEKELVLRMGVEGGGASVYRTPLASGGWKFHVEGSSMFLDENDDEGWRSWTGEPKNAFAEALDSVASKGEWAIFYPIDVHPEYRAAVWELVQQAAEKLPKEARRYWEERQKGQWRRLCSAT